VGEAVISQSWLYLAGCMTIFSSGWIYLMKIQVVAAPGVKGLTHVDFPPYGFMDKGSDAHGPLG
jgi:hypothetical protein